MSFYLSKRDVDKIGFKCPHLWRAVGVAGGKWVLWCANCGAVHLSTYRDASAHRKLFWSESRANPRYPHACKFVEWRS